ncbi:hypothetical protein [Saccharicrinis sp. GN24d3]|uniref:hypothetical protein n=1 Tax=Saccharicrinis sp. GN24d3 TaxID=3458416 RepID=UPI004035C26E
MKNHPLRKFYLIVFPILIVLAIVLNQNKIFGYQILGEAKKEIYGFSLEQTKSVFNKASDINSSGPWRVVFDSTSNIIGVLLHSNYYSPEVKGYHGRVPVIIAVDTDHQ